MNHNTHSYGRRSLLRAFPPALLLCALILSGCVSSGEFKAQADALERCRRDGIDLSAEIDRVRASEARLTQSVDRLSADNSRMVESNASLTAQLEALRLSRVQEEVGMGARLFECEFRTRELESQITDRDKAMRPLRAAVSAMEAEAARLRAGRAAEAAAANALSDLVEAVMLEELDTGGIALASAPPEVRVEFDAARLFSMPDASLTDEGAALLALLSPAIAGRPGVRVEVRASGLFDAEMQSAHGSLMGLGLSMASGAADAMRALDVRVDDVRVTVGPESATPGGKALAIVLDVNAAEQPAAPAVSNSPAPTDTPSGSAVLNANE
jgi:hypothetical protein